MRLTYQITALSLFTAISLPLNISYAEDNTPLSAGIDDDYGNHFLNYEPYIKPAKKPEVQKPIISKALPPTDKKEQKKGEQLVTIQWLRENYSLLQDRATDNPTDDNVSAWLYAKRISMDKAQRFSNKVTEITNEDPMLNENNRIPYASVGAQSVRNADFLAQAKAARELANTGGLMIFVDGACRFCAMQLPIMEMLKSNYGLETLVISIDGTIPKNFTGHYVKDNGLYKKLNLKLTPSIVYVNRPKSYTGLTDPNQYFIISQGFYTLDELTKQIAFAGFHTNLLTASTRSDLDVWNRGVASTEDMESLTLDSDHPETFRKKLEPILMKQY